MGKTINITIKEYDKYNKEYGDFATNFRNRYCDGNKNILSDFCNYEFAFHVYCSKNDRQLQDKIKGMNGIVKQYGIDRISVEYIYTLNGIGDLDYFFNSLYDTINIADNRLKITCGVDVNIKSGKNESMISDFSLIAWSNAFKIINENLFGTNQSSKIKCENVVFNVMDYGDSICNLRFFLPIKHYLRSCGTQAKMIVDVSDRVDGEIERITQFMPQGITLGKEPELVFRDSKTGTKRRPSYKNNNASDILSIIQFSDDYEDNLIAEGNKILNKITSAKTYMGTIDAPMSTKTKSTLCNELCDKLFDTHIERKADALKFFSKDDKLAILIFLFLIWQYIKDKSIFNIVSKSDDTVHDADETDDDNDNTKTDIQKQSNTEYKEKKLIWTLNESLIDKAILDAKSFSEGLWQLIENAQIHSCGKVAFLGMRYRKADSEAPMSEISENANTRKTLWDKYIPDHYTTDNIFNKKDSSGNRLYPNFLEFFVFDDAMNTGDHIGHGIIDVFKKNQSSLYETPYSIEGIFNLNEADYKDHAKLDFYTKHYGMRWFQHHIRRINGIMQIYSPCSNSCNKGASFYTYIDGNNGKRSAIIPDGLFTTTYSVLIPMNNKPYSRDYKVYQKTKDNKKSNGNENSEIDHFFLSPYDLSYPSNDFSKIEYRPREINSIYDNPVTEKNQIDLKHKAVIELKNTLFEEDPSENIMAYYLNLAQIKLNHLTIEILAKSIFAYIYELRSIKEKESTEKHKLYILIDFENSEDFIKEFVRIFSIFYIKQNANNYMKDVQIALASGKEAKKEVRFVIAGENIESAAATANNFVYYSGKSTINFVSLLNYLVKDQKDTDDLPLAVPLFPFELIPLPGEKDSMFIKHMNSILNNEIGGDEPGCKVSDIRVRLGSRIYMKNFYEAELLFHNVCNIRRFSYLIANDIVRSLPNDSNDTIMLIGYENYSAILTDEVKMLLCNWSKGKRDCVTAIGTQKGQSFPIFDLDHIPPKELNNVESAYTIVPIGTSMSTIYRLHDAFSMAYKKKHSRSIQFKDNYILVAVGDLFCDRNNINDSGLSYNKYFIKNTDKDNVSYVIKYDRYWNQVKLQPDISGSKCDTSVKFLLNAAAEWDKAKPQNKVETNCNMLLTPLLHVDGTSTILNASIRTPMNEDAIAFYYRNNSKKSVELLNPNSKKSKDSKIHYPFVYYGHIKEHEGKHFQFFFDMKKIINCYPDLVDIWLDKQASGIEANAYNIIITPLSESESDFLKAVLDKLFRNNFHLIHVDIMDVDKEDFRTHFNYISSELDEVFEAYAKVNFYYVDDAVYSGATISRAAKLLQMLIPGSGNTNKHHFIGTNGYSFKKVVLLVNQSSYETAMQFVSSPKDNWLAFIDLLVPSYNMKCDSCPGCEVTKRFDKLEKRCATANLSDHFNSKAKHHLPKTKRDILKAYEDNSGNINENNYEFQKYKNRSYIRLKTMNEAYARLVYSQDTANILRKNDSKELNDFYTREILKMLCSSFDMNIKEKADQIDYFISFLKVISREHLASIYGIRKAIYVIMHCILLILTEDFTEVHDRSEETLLNHFKNKADEDTRISAFYKEIINTDIINTEVTNNEKKSKRAETRWDYYHIITSNIRNWYPESHVKPILPELQSDIFQATLHRLAMLHSEVIIYPEMIERFINAYQYLGKRQTNKQKTLEEQQKMMNKLIVQCASSFKMASMAEDDDSMCILLNELYNEMKKTQTQTKNVTTEGIQK